VGEQKQLMCTTKALYL